MKPGIAPSNVQRAPGAQRVDEEGIEQLAARRVGGSGTLVSDRAGRTSMSRIRSPARLANTPYREER